MLKSVVKFIIEFFRRVVFTFANIGMSLDENAIGVADVYLGFTYYYFEYFVFDVGHE